MVKPRRLSVLCLVLASFLIFGCATTPLFGPTSTPTLTLTPTYTLTPVPTATPTPDPLALALDAADQSHQSGDDAQAIAKYADILQQFPDPSVHAEVFKKLEAIGLQTKQAADTQNENYTGHEDLVAACVTYALSLSAYMPILQAPDRPSSTLDTFYQDAAKVDVQLIDCHLWEDVPEQTYTQALNNFLTEMDLYPQDSLVQDILFTAALKYFETMVDGMGYGNIDLPTQDFIQTGQALTARAGDYAIGSDPVAASVAMFEANAALCSDPRFDFPGLEIGTSSTRRVETCPTFGNYYQIDDANLRASDPAEVWYILSQDSTQADEVACQGLNLDTGLYFSYTYPGQENLVYTLRNAHSGAVVSTKAFYGTAPRCVFSSCSLNTSTNTATCTGGEGSSPYGDENDAALIQWLKSFVR